MLFHAVDLGLGLLNHPCTLLRRDKVKTHADPKMHKASEQWEAMATMAAADGCIVHAFQASLSLKKKAVEGAIKILYWLSKNEIAHFTKFESLKALIVHRLEVYIPKRADCWGKRQL